MKLPARNIPVNWNVTLTHGQEKTCFRSLMSPSQAKPCRHPFSEYLRLLEEIHPSYALIYPDLSSYIWMSIKAEKHRLRSLLLRMPLRMREKTSIPGCRAG